MDYRILPPEELLQARVKLPLSKSMSNRAILINALTPDGQPLGELAKCDDTEAMLAGITMTQGTVDVGAAGTAMRFLTAYFASRPGVSVTIDGTERMRNRPIGPLVDALRACGADIAYTAREGFPPLNINGRALKGGEITVAASISSQFVSALMMVAPVMEEGLKITLAGEVTSMPYIRMTAEMMGRCGAEVTFDGPTVSIAPRPYSYAPLTIEGDWSAASYWYEIEALSSGFVTLDGLERFSCQGDSRVARIFSELGVTTEFEGEDGGTDLEASPDLTPRLLADMTDTPDLVQALTVTLAMLGVPFRLTGVKSLRIKETDRLEALRRELLKLGIIIDIEGDDTLAWEGARRPVSELPAFDTYSDHRMAMALAPVALYVPGIVIRNAEVVTKSYPEFWNHLTDAGFSVTDTADEPDGEEEAE